MRQTASACVSGKGTHLVANSDFGGAIGLDCSNVIGSEGRLSRPSCDGSATEFSSVKDIDGEDPYWPVSSEERIICGDNAELLR